MEPLCRGLGAGSERVLPGPLITGAGDPREQRLGAGQSTPRSPAAPRVPEEWGWGLGRVSATTKSSVHQRGLLGSGSANPEGGEALVFTLRDGRVGRRRRGTENQKEEVRLLCGRDHSWTLRRFWKGLPGSSSTSVREAIWNVPESLQAETE